MPKPRSSKVKSVPRKMHIFCEGEKTEPNYIEGYLKSLNDNALREVIRIADTEKNTPPELVREAVKAKNGGNFPAGDEFWVVYDRESQQIYPDRLHDQALTLANDNDVNIALSNVCFEHWLVLHFVDSSASYSSFEDLITNSCLKAEIKKATKQKYDKADAKIFDAIKAGIPDARRRATSINKRTLSSAPIGVTKPYLLNPYTDMPKLLDAIDNFSKK
ncbi:RloB family protein [Pseudomonas viridiflava]|uniref:RloB family protein n=1 Tax=Pseudomonas viridiflava TaxID=33069 RepID=UPI000F02C990|nr:RloB family protein [Pseudomonas viridiflava]